MVESTRSPRDCARGGRFLVKWLPLITICATLCLLVELGAILAQTPIAAPTIDSVTPDDGQLTIGWTAPAGVTGITAYDLRHIRSDAADKADVYWTEVPDVWTTGAGDLTYTLADLQNAVGYDVQLRTVTTTDGAWSGTSTGTPQITGPRITSVAVGDGALTVVWSAPAVAATTVISTYDVRYIESSAADKADANWTVVEEFWTSGSLAGVLAGLTNGTGYDVQVRAAADTDGAWSVTATGTPAEHGGTTATATTLPLTTRMGGMIASETDVDVFKIDLTAATGIIISTRGDLDTVGQLLDGDGMLIRENDEGDELQGRHNFLLWGSLQAGTYYVTVTGGDGATGAYVLETTTVADSTARSDAQDIEVGGFARGIIDTETTDKDWFRITLTGHTILLVHTTGPAHTSGDLWLSGTGRPPNVERFPLGGNLFFVRANLSPGTYYVEVDGYLDATGAYTLHVSRAAEPGSSAEAAEPLVPLFPKAGTISPANDVDYFRIEFAEATHVVLSASGSAVPIAGELLDSGGNPVDANIIESRYTASAPAGFTLRDRLVAGTYYLKVTRRPGSAGPRVGRYGLHMFEDYVYGEFFDGCTALTASLSDPLSDPLSGCQWHLENTGQLGGTVGEDINVREVWAAGHLGDGATVALVDNGMDVGHPDLAPNVIADRNYGYGGAAVYNPGNTHGTGAAGLIAARDNDIGVRGIAPRAQIYVYNIIDAYNHAYAADAMTRGMETTAISNNSWSVTEGPGYAAAPSGWESAVVRGVTEGYGGKGVLYVRSGGNDAVLGANSNLSGFRNHYTATAACAVTDHGVRSHYSEQGANLWVCAPSGASYLPAAITTTDNFGRYRNTYGGTSATAAIVSGVAALLRGAYSDLTWRDVKLILAGSARKNDPSNTGWEEGALQYRSTTEHYAFNHEYGFGVVDAKAAMDLAAGWSSPPQLTEETKASGDVNLAVPDLPSSGTPTTITSSITMGSGVQFTEFVSIRPSLTAEAFRDLQIELESPSGKVSVLSPYFLVGSRECTSLHGILPGRCNLDGFVRFGSAKHLGEDPAGVWTLRITDHVNGGAAARLNAWSLTVYGHRESPAAPAIDSVSAGGEALAVTWTAPTNTGASNITAYDVRYILTSADETADSNWTVLQDVWTSGSGDLSYVATGLTGSAEYDVQVRGVNAAGDGLWSDTATGTPTTDEAPTIDALTPGDRSIVIGWTAPTNAGLGTVTAYDLRYIRSDATDRSDASWTVVSAIWTSGSLEYTLNPTTTPLVNGVSYDVQVRAVVGSVQHPWSGDRSATPRTTPGAPTIDSVTAGDGELTVAWSAPASDGGADITADDVRHIRSDAADKADDEWTVTQDVWASTGGGALEYTLSGLTTDVQYDVQVRAVNAAGDGLWSATATGTPRIPPGAPEAVQVYVYMTGKLEVRWSAADFASTTGFKVQWRSGDQDWDASRSDEVDPATAHVEWSSTPDSRRYRHGLDGLTNGTAYEVRVIASNAGVDGDASAVATGTPQWDSTHAQAATFIENELISVHEDANPWLRVAFDWIDAANKQNDPYGQKSGIDFHLGQQYYGQVVHSCFNSAGADLHHSLWDARARYCQITWLYINWDFVDVIPLITHELGHVLTLTNRLEGSPEVPIAIARLYFARVDHGCDYRPARELLADLLMVSVFGDAGLGETGYWRHCVSRDTEEALEVVRTALAGEMPAWLAETYDDENGDLDLALVWSHIKAEGGSSGSMRDLMRTAFGGLCRSDALWNSAIRIPWRDGGCVPQAPAGLAAVAAVDGIMAVSWQAPDDDGGSRITGYTVQWKSGAQDYDASRETSVTDLADLSHTIEGLSHGVDYTIRILASNINGDGAASEVTTTAVGSEAALETLTLAGATLYPTFSSTTSSYAAVTGHAATQITIAATAADADASVAFLDVDGNALTDAGTAAEFQVNVSVGANVIQVRVTAQDGVAATYTVTVTRAAENTSLSPPASDPPVPVASTALYTIVFQGAWTTDVTPDGRPSGAHFSPLIGGVHGADVTFLERGGTASGGVEQMAEIGGTGKLRNEVQAAINATPATALSVLRRSGNIGATGSDTLSNVMLTTEFPRVTLTTMIAPSHDWFVGVSGLPLLNAQGNWLAWVRVFLYPWDAGSEEGNDFSLSPSVDTSPRGVIHSIRGTGKFSTERIATLTFTLESMNFAPTGAPFIAGVTGAPEVGEELTAHTSAIADGDGLASPGYKYQWLRVDAGGQAATISGATSPTYTVQGADVGRQLTVRVSFTDDNNTVEELTSDATEAVMVTQVTVSFGAGGYAAAEGGQRATVKVMLDKDPHRTLRIPLHAATGGGADSSDYAATAQVTFRPGETEKEAHVTAADDRVDDDGESVTLSFGDLPDGVSAGSPSETVVELIDDDYVPVTLGWEETAFTAEEPTSPGATTAVNLRAEAVTATDKRPESGFTLAFTVRTVDGTAQQPDDYEEFTAMETFDHNDFFRTPVGGGQFRYVASVVFTVTVAHDTVDEPLERFTVLLALAGADRPHLILGAATATLTTTDDVASLVDLRTTVTARTSAVEPGEELTYEWSIYNSGPAAATSTVLTGTLDGGMTFVSAQVTSPATGQCGRSGRTVACAVGTLEVGDTAVGEIVVQVRDGASADMGFTAVAAADQLDRRPADDNGSVTTALDAPPGRVTDLRATGERGHIDVTWSPPDDNGSAITGYELERKAGTDDYASVFPQPPQGTTSHRDEDVSEGTEYTYRLRAVNEDGEAEWSNEATATTRETPAPPPPPPPPQQSSGGGGGGGGVGGGGGGTPRNRSPAFTDGDATTRSVPENTAAGQDIGAPLEAVDPDRRDTLTYTLEGEDVSAFDIDAATGQLQTRAPLDYETRISYTLTARVEDRRGRSDVMEVTVTVTNVGLDGTAGRYDTDDNGAIDRDEAIAAVVDYFNGVISKEETIEVVRVYFAG